MPRTVKEIVYFKLNALQGKFHHAQKCVDKLHESLESLPEDINYVNVALDNILMSFDEFAANFDDLCPGFDENSQTPKKFPRRATSHIPSTQVSGKDTENTVSCEVIDILLSRVNKLEEDLSVMRSTIHGGGDGEGSPHRSILSHLSVLENSFNKGKQQLISIEQKAQDIDVKYGRFVDEMSAKTVKEDQQKEMDNISFNKRIHSIEVENVALTKEFKNFEDTMKSVKSVIVTTGDQAKELESIAVKRFEKIEKIVEEVISNTDACKKKLASVEGELKTVKGMIETKEYPEKESENNSLRERVDKLEEKLETTVSDTDSSKDRLKQVEDQLKAVKLDIVTSGDLAKELDRIAVKRFEKLQNKVEEVVSDTDACKKKLTSVEGELKTVKGMIETKEYPEKESENNSVRERVDKLEEKLETTVSDTDSSKDRLTQVEDQLKEVEPVRGADLDSSVKAQILQRISVLGVKLCSLNVVWLKHNGPWRDGVVIRDVNDVDFNVGNAFQEDQCRFLAPVDGIYCMTLYLNVKLLSHKSQAFLQTYDVTENKWNDEFCVVNAEEQINGGANCDVALVELRKGEAVRAKVGNGDAFNVCIIYGWLVSATT